MEEVRRGETPPTDGQPSVKQKRQRKNVDNLPEIEPHPQDRESADKVKQVSIHTRSRARAESTPAQPSSLTAQNIAPVSEDTGMPETTEKVHKKTRTTLASKAHAKEEPTSSKTESAETPKPAEPKRIKQAETPATELSKKELTHKDVRNILDAKPLTEEQRKNIIEKYNEIKKNYSSFETAETPEGLLTDTEMLNIAIHIITVLPRIKETASRVFETGAADHVLHQTGLSRDILITKEGSFLLPDHNLSKIKGEGTFKLASSIMALYSEHKYVLLKTKPDAEMTESVRAKTLQEGEMQCSLSGEQGIAKCHSVINYANGQIGFLVEKAHGDFHNFLFEAEDSRNVTQATKKTVNVDQQITVMSDLTAGLCAIHEKGIVHGDIKGENILFTIDENGEIIKIGITDFGESFYITPGEKDTWSKSEQFKVGEYGTAGYTSPELLGQHHKFNGDFYKTDVWAAGMVLYQMHFKTDPPWKRIVNIFEGKYFIIAADEFVNKKQLKITQKKFNDVVIETIEKERTKLFDKENRTVDEEIELLIYDMLRLDPNERISSADAAARVREIEDRRNAETETQNMNAEASDSDQNMPVDTSESEVENVAGDTAMRTSPDRREESPEKELELPDRQAEQPDQQLRRSKRARPKSK